MRLLNDSQKKFYYIIILSGLMFLIMSFMTLPLSMSVYVLFFILIRTLGESMAIKLDKNITLSISFAVDIAVILIFKWPYAGLIGFFPLLFYVEISHGRIHHLFNSSFYKRFFNGSSYMIAVFTFALTYQL